MLMLKKFKLRQYSVHGIIRVISVILESFHPVKKLLNLLIVELTPMVNTRIIAGDFEVKGQL